MKDVRVDADGTMRCWNCGGKNLVSKRTARAKVMGGVGALLTKKKLKCQQCGEYNDVGDAKPYDGPVDQPHAAQVATVGAPSLADELAKLAALRDQGVLTDAEFETKKAQLLSGG